MKLYNPLTGVQVSVEDDEGDRLLATGAWAKGDTPADWKAPKPGEAPAAAKPAAKATSKSDAGTPAQ